MESRESPPTRSSFLRVLFPAAPGCSLPACRCRALPSAPAGAVARSTPQPGTGPCASPGAGYMVRVASSHHRPWPYSAHARKHGAERSGEMRRSSQTGKIWLRKAEKGEKGVEVNHSPERLEVEPAPTTFPA